MNHYSGLQHTLKDCQACDSFRGELNLSIFNPIEVICCSCNDVRPVAIKALYVDAISCIRPDNSKTGFLAHNL